VQLQNVWAPTKVLAPWAYQPHYAQHVDPWTGTKHKIIAVPAGRYEGNENARGGYGAFKPENVWGSQVDKNTNPSKPMMILCHSDGDNYGLKNSDAWNAQHGYFLDMCKNNADFEHTSVQDYLSMYPPDANDIVHVEPGSWVGIDGGTPYFDKWMSYEERSGVMPDMWSWSVLVAGQNYVLTADALENSYLNLDGGRTMDDVEWGTPNDTARAWHFYLSAETSCYWYWDFDDTNPWDGNATRAVNLAIAEANKVLDRHEGSDPVGPSIFPPQRLPYNPGGKMWNEAENASSDFQVWTFAEDVSGVASVKLNWRADLDGLNPIGETDNEVYARNAAKVGAWNEVAMSGDWWPGTKGPNVPDPTKRAKRYTATVAGQNNVLIDYYVEAMDTKGNATRSDIFHVWVGEANTNVPQPSVEFDPAAPNGCTPVTVKYKKTGLLGSSQVYIHIGRNGWQDVVTPDPAMIDSGDYWTYVYVTPTNTTEINVCFNDGADTWDNNGTANWNVGVANCGSGEEPDPAVWTEPASPVGCDPISIFYNPAGRPLAGASQINIHVGRNGWQDVVDPDPAMTASGTNWTYVYTPAPGTTNIDFVFNAVSGSTTNWDNNGSADWHVAVSGCESEPPVPNGVVITNPATESVTVNHATSTYALQGTAGADLSGNLAWTNTLNGLFGTLTRQTHWSVPVDLAVGQNVITVSGLISGSAGGTIVAEDTAADAAYATSWDEGSNGGTGFGPWDFNHNQDGTTFWAGVFIGPASAAGITGFGEDAFGFFANPAGVGANAEVLRDFTTPMAVGSVFSFDWGVNWDSDAEGSYRGFSLLAGDTELVYINMGNSPVINITGGTMFTNYGTQAMTLNFEYVASGSIRVWGTGRDGLESYDQTLTVPAGAPSRIKFYFNGSTVPELDEDHDKRQMYVDNLKITVPGGGEPTYSTDTVTIVRQDSGSVGPSIPPIVFEAGTGFWFDIPSEYELYRVEGADLVIGQAWNWTLLTENTDYTLAGGRLTLLTGATDKRMVRIWLNNAAP
jgi:hypothetical protein